MSRFNITTICQAFRGCRSYNFKNIIQHIEEIVPMIKLCFHTWMNLIFGFVIYDKLLYRAFKGRITALSSLNNEILNEISLCCRFLCNVEIGKLYLARKQSSAGPCLKTTDGCAKGILNTEWLPFLAENITILSNYPTLVISWRVCTSNYPTLVINRRVCTSHNRQRE